MQSKFEDLKQALEAGKITRPEINLDGFKPRSVHLTRAERFGVNKEDHETGKSGEWFIGARVVSVRLETHPDQVLQIGTTKSTAKWIAEMTARPCSSQKLRRALKNGHRCNGFLVEYKVSPK